MSIIHIKKREHPYVQIDKAMSAIICPQELPVKLMVYFGCSKWTSANRNHAGHISEEYGQPLCGKKYSAGASDKFLLTEKTASQVTCERCKKLAEFDLRFGK